MGTSYSVKIPATAVRGPALPLETGMEAILADITRKMSTYIDNSELSVINQSTGTDWINVSADLYKVIETAMAISRATDGAFDITVGAAVNLWGFGPEMAIQRIPAEAELALAMQGTGFRRLSLRPAPAAIKKGHPGTYLDLSGIAKGYAVDRLAGFLEQNDIEDYLVEIGGEIRARGVNQHGEVWRVGIESPVADRRAIQKVITLGGAMATSGDYRNFFVHRGRRYSHTIDPKTGWPVSHDLVSVTVVDESATVADALATALLVMGAGKGFDYAEKAGIPALFIVDRQGEFMESATTALNPYLIE